MVTTDVVTGGTNMLVECFTVAVNMLLQQAICFICYTMGASDHLRRFDCFLIKDSQGNLKIRYEMVMSESVMVESRESSTGSRVTS